MRIALPSPKPCSECGSDPILHAPEYAANFVGAALQPLIAGALAMTHVLTPAPKAKPMGVWSLGRVLERLGLAEYLPQPDSKTLLLDHVLWQEATARGIAMREWRPLGLPVHSFEADLPHGTLSFDSVPIAGKSPWWVDNKQVSKKRLRAHGVPVPQGQGVWTLAGALRVFRQVGAPVVVKPAEGSATRHTTLHINTEAELTRAFRVAKQMGPVVMVEQELAGAVYRPTLVQAKLAATLRRDQPQVVGDGKHTVEELVAAANTHPARQGPYFHHIKLGAAADAELARQGHSRNSTPKGGEVVHLHQKINWSVGGTTTDVTDEVHPDNVELFERVAAILQAPLLGLDFITTDITRSWREVPCGIIECNARPFFDNHHLPFSGNPRNVAGVIWDAVQGQLSNSAGV